MSDLFNLAGKVALITGASSGMGKAIATAMATNGCTIILSSNNHDEGILAQEELVSMGSNTAFFYCDMSSKDDIDQLVNNAISQYGKINILVSCVGIDSPGSMADFDEIKIQKTISINIENTIYLTSKVLPSMRGQKGGSLIYLASIAGVRGNKTIGLYGMTKAALIQMVKNLAVEFGPENIRANTISPGLIETPFSESLMQNAAFMERRLALTPLRRVGQVEEIAGVAVMLASSAGGFITGQNIIVDGGTTITDGN